MVKKKKRDLKKKKRKIKNIYLGYLHVDIYDKNMEIHTTEVYGKREEK